MTSKKPLSKKKIAQQTISISPALRYRIERYVSNNNKKNPKDNRVKSISAFYNFVMEKSIDSFEKGKTLDDLEGLADSEINDFFERLSFSALIPYYENAIRTNKYTNPTLEKNPFFFLTLRRLYMTQMDPYDIKSIKTIFDRVQNYILSNNITKEFSLDIFSGKGKGSLTGIFEYDGIYKNLSFETCKYTTAIFGLLGVKLTELLYSEKENYYRLDLEATDLFFKKDMAKQERIKLMNHNVSYLINYNRMLNDNDYYFWMKMAEDKNIIICFNDEETQKDWMHLIENEIKKFGDNEEYDLNMLKFFEKLHWIEIESSKDLSFQIKLSKIKNQFEREFLLEVLSRKSQVLQVDEKYSLKNLSSK